jgi:DNA-binding GntR family transcriptional regulator
MRFKKNRVSSPLPVNSLIKEHKSKTELVYETLKKAIINGKWQAGKRRNTIEIAKALKVSRTPVLEACKLLETEGLLKIRPQVGVEVPKLSQQGIEEIFHIRGALSGLATEQACRFFKERDIKKLRELAEAMDRCLPEKDYIQFSKLNREFHYCIFKKCNLPHLLMLLGRYWDSGNRYAPFFKYLPKIMASSAQYHHDILNALASRDEMKARQAAEKDSLEFGLEVSKFLMQMANPWTEKTLESEPS